MTHRAGIHAITNGHAKTPGAPAAPVVRMQKRVPVLPTVSLQNVDADRVTMLMIGTERSPEMACPLDPVSARKLAEALVQHADAIERAAPRIILPGASGPLPPPPTPRRRP